MSGEPVTEEEAFSLPTSFALEPGRSEAGIRLAHVELSYFERAPQILRGLEELEGLDVGSSVVPLESDSLELSGDVLFGELVAHIPGIAAAQQIV